MRGPASAHCEGRVRGVPKQVVDALLLPPRCNRACWPGSLSATTDTFKHLGTFSPAPGPARAVRDSGMARGRSRPATPDDSLLRHHQVDRPVARSGRDLVEELERVP